MSVALVVVAAIAVGLAISQRHSRQVLKDRHQARTDLTASFISSYAMNLMDREGGVARRALTGAGPDLPNRFEQAASAFDFGAAVLLDDRGAVLAVSPPNPGLVGKVIAPRYRHLSAAVAGQRAVSQVVASGSTGQPVVGFAVPFDTASGRRVLSGAYVISSTPLSAFLSNALAIPGTFGYLVDESGQVVASTKALPGGVIKLTAVDADLVRARRAHPAGTYRAAGQSRYYSSAQVDGTPWTVVMISPTSGLLAPVSGALHLVPWLTLALLAAVLVVAAVLAQRYVQGRRALLHSNAVLEQIASTDELTGTFNRRHAREHLETLLAASARHGFPLSVALADVDHFKRVNDTFGHSAGDSVLAAVAGHLGSRLRREDILARWGGEEFLLVFAHLDEEQALRAAERLRVAVEGTPIEVGAGGDEIKVTVSIGVATWRADEHPDALIHRADIALYRAKNGGRNRVVNAAQLSRS